MDAYELEEAYGIHFVNAMYTYMMGKGNTRIRTNHYIGLIGVLHKLGLV